MKKLLLSLTIVFSMGFMMAQDCASFIRYYDQNYSYGMDEGGDPLVNFTNPTVNG